MNATRTDREIASQPEVWRAALERRPEWAPLLRAPGERMLVIGCGTSAFMAGCIATLRESAGLGETDAAFASELRRDRVYDRVVVLSRSGTTTEVLDAVRDLAPATTVAITAVPDSPLSELTDHSLVLDIADETSVVQTRFPTAVLVLALACFGYDVSSLSEQCAEALADPPLVGDGDVRHFVFLGHDWTVGLADEAALKIREAAQAWSESYPMYDYRHGPIAVADEHTLVFVIGPAPDDLLEDIRATGAAVVSGDRHPLVQLVEAQRLAVSVARARGLDPDTPRHLTRSVILNRSS